MEGLVQQHLEGQLLNAAKQIEDRVDNQLHQLDKLEGDDYERLQEQRLQDIKRQVWSKKLLPPSVDLVLCELVAQHTSNDRDAPGWRM